MQSFQVKTPSDRDQSLFNHPMASAVYKNTDPIPYTIELFQNVNYRARRLNSIPHSACK